MLTWLYWELFSFTIGGLVILFIWHRNKSVKKCDSLEDEAKEEGFWYE